MTDTVKTANDAEPLVVQERSSALLTVIFLCFSGMSVALMQTLVIPIQSELPQILNTSAANASWVVTITLLGAAVAMPIAGRLGDLFGKQRVLVGSSVLLLAGSLVCALSDSLVPVVAGRGLQGLRDGLHPGRHQPDARGRPAGDGDHRRRGDERDPRRRRRDRPAAVGLDRADR